MRKTTKDHQKNCVEFKEATKRMECLNQPGMKVKSFAITVVSKEGNKVTLSFDSSKVKQP